MPKVAFLITAYNSAKLLRQTLRFMEELDPQPDKYVFSENNSTDGTLNVIRQWQCSHPTEIIRLWFREDAVQILGNKYEVLAQIRDTLLNRARKMDVDYAIFVDSDIFITHTDFITRITSWNKNLVGAAVPVFRASHGLCLSPTWINCGSERETKPQIVKTVCDGFEEVYSVGAGALCISRKLLMDREVNFSPTIRKPQVYGEDISYCIKARQHGYKVYVDGSLLLGHYVEAKIKNLWHDSFQYGEDPRGGGMMLMPEDYIASLLEIDRLMAKNV